MSSSLRKKVNDFFNPVPGGASNSQDGPITSAAQMLDEEGLGFEDDGNNMRKYFNKGASDG